MTLSRSLAAIAWDPQIRGALSVVVMVALLMGSVYVVLATNLAKRLGFLVALTGFFGWMTLLGINWWVYGQGWIGDEPTWEVEEINTGDLAAANLEEARSLSPELIEEALEVDPVFQEAQDEAVAEAAENGDPEPLPFEVINSLTPDQFEELSEEVKDDLGGWRLLDEANPVRGDAQSVVDEALQGADYPGLDTPNEYVVQYGMDIGGKPPADDDDLWDVISNRVTNTLKFKHPPKYAIVMVQPGSFETPPVPGEPPPTVVPNDDSEVVSVVMVRNLGDLRLPAAMTTIVSGMLFGLGCYMLHVRDKTIEANRAAPLPEVPGAGPGLQKADGAS